jgi:hypothetical protein
MSRSPQLTEEEVRERLGLTNDPVIIDDLYNFGQKLEKSAIEHIQIVESKAISFAAYGAAIVTLLVSSSSSWARLGNQWTLWIAFCAGASAVICTYFSIQALLLKQFDYISQDEWLNAECLSDIDKLKRYRILTLWGTIDSHDKIHSTKATALQHAEVWLAGSVIFLVYLLLHIACVRIGLWQSMVKDFAGIPGWQVLTSSTSAGLLCGLVLGLTFIVLIFSRSRGTT